MYAHYQTEGAAIDAARDCYLNSLGLDVLRFSNFEVLQNMEGVPTVIFQKIEAASHQNKTKSPSPLFQRSSTIHPSQYD
ncbi:MAG: DUF559 domain-containing protein [Deltaproteobacteria bacterium]|nr:DUF559 domain-containing protein [Deltaproteobacteria bacterium]MBN2671556.1 DUF559 domain-containing protein [Deltaproteobacteria bacterium]